jgi:Homeodomain-like domain
MVEIKGFKTSHSMGVKTALVGPITAGSVGYVECPESACKPLHRLADRGWSQRRIGRELGIDRETVGRYLRLAEAKPAISTELVACQPLPVPERSRRSHSLPLVSDRYDDFSDLFVRFHETMCIDDFR